MGSEQVSSGRAKQQQEGNAHGCFCTGGSDGGVRGRRAAAVGGGGGGFFNGQGSMLTG